MHFSAVHLQDLDGVYQSVLSDIVQFAALRRAGVWTPFFCLASS